MALRSRRREQYIRGSLARLLFGALLAWPSAALGSDGGGGVGSPSASAPASARARPSEDRRPVVVAVELEGVPRMDGPTFAARSGIRIDGPLRADRVREAIKALYRSGGYRGVEALVREVGETPDGRSRVVLVFRALSREVLEAIEFEGNKKLKDDELKRAARVAVGMALSDDVAGSIRGRLIDLYAARGWSGAEVRVTAKAGARPHQTVITVEVHEGEPTRISDIRFDGALPVEPELLVRVLSLRRGGVLDTTRFRADREALRAWFMARTYYNVKVREPKVEAGSSADSAVLVFSVSTGPRFQIEFEGNRVLSDGVLRTVVESGRAGGSFDGRMRERLADELELRYQELGYLMAAVTLKEERSPDDSEVTVTFVIDEGRAYLLRPRSIVFEGFRPLSLKSLRNQLVGVVEEKILERGLHGRGLLHSKHRALSTDEMDTLERTPAYLDAPPDPVRYGADEVYVPDLFDTALDTVRDLYRERGYWSVEIDPPSISLDDERGLVAISIHIETGPKQVLGDVAFVGTALPRKDLLEAVSTPNAPAPALAIDKPLSPLAVDNGRIGLLEHYANEGYPWAAVDYEIDRSDPTSAVVRFRVVEGDRVTISDVLVEGNIVTSEHLIRAQLGFVAGDTLRADVLREAERKLLLLGVFVAVNVDFEDPDTPSATKRVLVTVREDAFTSVEWSVGASTDDGPRGFAVVGYSNLGGLAWSVLGRLQMNIPSLALQIPVFNPGGIPDEWPRLIRGRTEYSLSRGSANLEPPPLSPDDVANAIERKLILGLTKRKLVDNFLGTPLDFSVELVHSRDTELAFGLTKWGGVARFASSEHWRVNYQLEADIFWSSFQTYNVAALEALADQFRPKLFPDTRILLASVRPTFTFDTRDSLFNPTSGILARISGDWVVSIVDGRPVDADEDPKAEPTSVNALRTEVMFNAYFKLFKTTGLVLALSFRGGSVFNIVRGKAIPPDRAFFLGGRNSIRSFFERSMIPEDVARGFGSGAPDRNAAERAVPVPANLYVLARTELRFPISSFEGAVFVDAGNSWADISEAHRIKFFPRVALGGAIRYPSPVGPISVEIGFNLFARRCVDDNPAHTPFTSEQGGCELVLDDASVAWHLAIGVF